MRKQSLLACCRTGVMDTALFPHWLDHYSSHAETIVALCVHRPGEDTRGLRDIAATRPRLRLGFLESEHFEDTESMTRLHEMIKAAGRHDWVIHADVDELVDMDGIQDRLNGAHRDGAHWIKGWIVDRFAVGGRIPELDPHRSLAEQFPVWTSATQVLCRAAGEKCSLCLWPDIGAIHQFSSDWRNRHCASEPVLVHHFKWHSNVIERTVRWIEDYVATGKPWEGWTATRHRFIDHYDRHGGRVAVENYLWRNWVHGWFDYATWYEQLAQEVPEEGILVEAGVWQGASLIHLAQACHAVGKPVEIYGVDLFARAGYLGTSVPPHLAQYTEHGSWMHLVTENLRAHRVLDAVNLLQLSITRAARAFDDASVFACFVDGGHHEAAVSADIDAWWPKIAPGGYLSGHDWNHPEVRVAVERLAASVGRSIMNHGPTVWILQKPAA